jgi:hypothetical protein
MKQEDPSPAGVHLDTTVMLEQFKVASRAAKVVKALSHFRFKSTSTFARHEMNRTWLSDLAYLYEQARKYNRIEDIYAQIGRSFHGGQYARLTRCLEIMQSLLSVSPGTISRDAELARLRSHIAHAITNMHAYWNRKIVHQFDGTLCFIATIRPVMAPNGMIEFALGRCKTKNIRCCVHDFFDQHRNLFEKVRTKVNSLKDASNQLKAAAETLLQTANNSKHLCDSNNCRRIGDALIAIDSESVPVMAANNDRDWVPIAEALEKKLINPTRDREESLFPLTPSPPPAPPPPSAPPPARAPSCSPPPRSSPPSVSARSADPAANTPPAPPTTSTASNSPAPQ